MAITPINTVYRGNNFRSRLEARWAVFLETMRVEYVYEPDGYALPSGWYLPDFWVGEWDSFVEVKPVDATGEEKLKCRELAAATGKRVICIQGQPYIDEYFISFYSADMPRGITCLFYMCSNCESLLIADRDSGIMFQDSIEEGCQCGGFSIRDAHCGRIKRSFDEARAYRF